MRTNIFSKDKIDISQDFIPVKDIRNGMIETTDNRYVKILEIEPTNFSMKSSAEKNTIISNFAGWMKGGPINFQFKVLTKKAESSKHVAEVREELSMEKTEMAQIQAELSSLSNEPNLESSKKSQALANRYAALQKYTESLPYKTRMRQGEEYIELVKRLSALEALTRRFFIIFDYESDEGFRSSNYSEILSNMNLIEKQTITALYACGNAVIQTKNVDEKNMHLAEILYSVVDRKEQLKKTFDEHVNDVIMKTMARCGLVFGKDPVPEIPAVDFIAPKRINLSNRKFIFIDGLYYNFLMVSAKGYPNEVYAGWLGSVINYGEGIDVDVYAKKVCDDSVISKINNRLALHKAKANETSDTNNAAEDIEDALKAGFYIKDRIREKQDLYYMNVLITITADNLTDLDLKKRGLLRTMKSESIDTYNCIWKYEQAFISALPLCKLDKQLFDMAKRNIMTLDLASVYPFTAYEICDDDGVLYGVNAMNESLCIVDIFNQREYKNANMCLFGSSGSGKTFTLGTFSIRQRMRGIQCFIIAPLKGHEFLRACKYMGGTFIKICAGSPFRINVMDIRVPDKSAEIALEGADFVENESLLAKKVQDLKTFFELLIPEMTNVQEQLLDESIIETYANFGITHDNSSLYTSDDKTQLKEMPILGDLYDVLVKRSETDKELKGIATVINLLVNGSASNFNGHTNVNLDNKYVVLDISELTGKLLPVGMFLALDFVWSKVKENRTEKKAVFIDEVWKLIGAKSNENAAEFVLELYKTIRGYGGAAISASQDLNDFFALDNGKYGKGIINSSSIKIVKYLESGEAQSVQDAMNLTDSEMKEIEKFDRSQGLFCANSNRVPVVFVASDIEKVLITTDRKELKALIGTNYLDYFQEEDGQNNANKAPETSE